MKHSRKQLNWEVLFQNFTLNFIVFLDFLLILGLIMGKTKFLYSSLASFFLILSMTLLVTILYSSDLYLKLRAGLDLKSKQLIASFVLRAFLLFQLSKVLVNIINVWILLLPVVITVASFSFYFFWKPFQRELAPLFSFLGLAGEELSKVAKIRMGSLSKNIKAKTADLPAANALLRRKDRIAAN